MNAIRLAWLPALLASGVLNAPAEPVPLAWSVAKAADGCRAATAVETTRGGAALELLTRSPADDPGALRTELRVDAGRLDGKPMCTLGDLAAPGASLAYAVFRDPASGEGMPDYTCPYLALRVRAADGSVVRLLWEAPYNGYMTKERHAFPEGQWVSLQTATGRFWMATDAALFNAKDGFQPLPAWASGHVTEWRSNRTAALSADSPVVGLTLGSGNGLPGTLHAFVDAVALTLTNGVSYRLDPLLNRSAPLWTNAAARETGKMGFALSRKGRAQMAVVVASNACDSVRESAAQLAGMLGRMIGDPVPLVTGDGTEGLAVGLPADFPALGLEPAFPATSDLAALQRYRLKSHAKGIALIGATGIAVEYAVWDLLHRLGYRQFFPGLNWEVAPAVPDAVLEVDADETPDYMDRRIWYGFGGDAVRQRDWNLRNRMSMHGWRADWRPALPERWKTTLINAHHAYGAIVALNKDVFAAHPEYFALVNSNRTGGKLCISNTNVPPLAVAYARDWFDKHPDSACVSMEPTDGYGWCECSNCAALGSPSTRAVRLANAVAAELETSHPGKWVGMLAYAQHADPPAVPVHPRVVVSCATGLSGPVPVEERLKGWRARASVLGVYDYYAVAQWHLAMPGRMQGGNLDYLAKTIPAFHGLGARVMCAEAGDCWGPNGLGYYAASRLLWSTNEAAAVNAIREDFLTSCFGPAAEPMRAFYALLDNSRNAETGGGKPGSVEYFENRVRRMDACLVKAAERAGPDAAVQARLDDLFLYARYIQLWCAMKRAEKPSPKVASHEAVAARLDATERLIRFSYRIRETGMAHWDGVRNVVAGAAAVDLKSPPSWLDDREKLALELKGAPAAAALVREWSELTPALKAEVRAEAGRLAAGIDPR